MAGKYCGLDVRYTCNTISICFTIPRVLLTTQRIWECTMFDFFELNVLKI